MRSLTSRVTTVLLLGLLLLADASPSRGQDEVPPAAETPEAPAAVPYLTSIVFASVRNGQRDIYRYDLGVGTRKITSDAVEDGWPTASPDGQRICFESKRTDNWDIWCTDRDGNNAVNLTNQSGDDGIPRFSPDGRLIAYHRLATGESHYQLWVMNADGTNKRRVTNLAAYMGAPSWFPDSRRLVFDSDFVIRGINIDGTGLINYTDDLAWGTQPIVSPDGRFIYYIAYIADYGSQLHRIGTDGRGQTQLTFGPDTIANPQFAPDGAHLLLTSTRDHNDEIYLTDLNGTPQQRLTVNTGLDSQAMPLNTTLLPLLDKPQFAVKTAGDIGSLLHPRSAALAPDGTVWVADSGNHRLQQFDADGYFLATLGGQGSGPGQFQNPGGVAVDATGRIFVADTYNHRIQVFGASGMFLNQWGNSGSDAGQLHYPFALDIGDDGVVYVADTYNHRIQRFTAAGSFLGQWGSYGEAEGQLNTPFDLAAGRDGRVYVLDTDNSRIQVFTPSGQFVAAWGTSGGGEGQFSRPQGISAGPDGTIYVADSGNCRIQRFTATGEFLFAWGTSGPLAGQFEVPTGIAIGAIGVYIVDNESNRLQRFTRGGAFLLGWGYGSRAYGQFQNPYGIAVAPDGTVYAADTGYNRIQRLAANGQVLASWGASGSGPGQFANPHSIGIGPSGDVYVVDSSNSRIQQFTATGQFVRAWGSYGSGQGQFLFPWGQVAIAASGLIYVADDDNSRIQYFSATGQFLGQWGSYGSAGGQLSRPRGVAVAPDGEIFVADTGNHRIQRFTGTGNFLGQWGSPGVNAGELSSPVSLTIAADGTVYVADSDNSRIQRFTAVGQFLGSAGQYGSRQGELGWPIGGVAADSNSLYVADTGNDRVQAFAANYRGDWRGEYFANRWLAGPPALVRGDATINFQWRDVSPDPALEAASFSVRWERTLYLDAANYRFTVTADDGVRLWVDENLVIDQWQAQVATFSGDALVATGYHHIRLDYYQSGGWAQVQLTWAAAAPATATRTPTPTATWTAYPTPTPTTTASRTATATPSRTASMTATATATASRTATATPSRTASMTATATATATATPAPTRTATPSTTATGSVTPTPSRTGTPTPTSTPTRVASFAAFLPLLSHAAYVQPASLSFVPDRVEVRPGETFSVDISIENVIDLYSLDLTLSFDPTVLEVVDSAPALEGTQLLAGSFLDPALSYVVRNQADNQAGEIGYIQTLAGSAHGRSGSGRLATIVFRAKHAGITWLRFMNPVLADAAAHPIGVVTIDRSLRIGPLTSPTSTPTLTPTPLLLCNADFETGAFEPCWAHGGHLAQRVIDILNVGEPNPTMEMPRAGRYTAELGDPSLGPSLPTKTDMPIGSAWMEQSFAVPDTNAPQLTFSYRIVTYDVATDRDGRRYDGLQVTVNGMEMLWEGNQQSGTSQRRHDLGWRDHSINLASWRGERVTVRFANWNGIEASAPEADRNNTWTYVDQVEVRP